MILWRDITCLQIQYHPHSACMYDFGQCTALFTIAGFILVVLTHLAKLVPRHMLLTLRHVSYVVVCCLIVSLSIVQLETIHSAGLACDCVGMQHLTMHTATILFTSGQCNAACSIIVCAHATVGLIEFLATPFWNCMLTPLILIPCPLEWSSLRNLFNQYMPLSM